MATEGHLHMVLLLRCRSLATHRQLCEGNVCMENSDYSGASSMSTLECYAKYTADTKAMPMCQAKATCCASFLPALQFASHNTSHPKEIHCIMLVLACTSAERQVIQHFSTHLQRQ